MVIHVVARSDEEMLLHASNISLKEATFPGQLSVVQKYKSVVSVRPLIVFMSRISSTTVNILDSIARLIQQYFLN